MNIHYSKEIVNNIRQTDMVEFLEKRNSFSFKKQGTDFRCKEHSSLIIRSDKYRWFWNSKAIGGSGVIDYLMKIENTTFPEAIVAAQSIICMPTTFSQTPEARNRAIFSLPEKEKLSPSKLIRYLCEIRGINHNIVSQLIEEDKIYQDKRGNIVFVGVDENNKPRFASIRGAGEKHFRMDCSGSDKRFSFHLKGSNTETLYIFESPIDALSYATLENIKQSCNASWESLHCLSLGGTSQVALDSYLLKNKDIKKLVICLDNDDAGFEATNKIIEKYSKSKYRVSRLLPKGKDFDDELINSYA